jgi:hypothetical protein
MQIQQMRARIIDLRIGVFLSLFVGQVAQDDLRAHFLVAAQFGLAEVSLGADVDRVRYARGILDDVDARVALRLRPREARIDEEQPQDLLAGGIGLLIEGVSAMDRQFGHRRGVCRRVVSVDADIDVLDFDRRAFDEMQPDVDEVVLFLDLSRQLVGQPQVVVAVRLVKNPQPLQVVGESTRIEFRTRLPWRIERARLGAHNALQSAVGENTIALERNRADLPLLRRIEVIDRQRISRGNLEDRDQKTKCGGNSDGAILQAE